MGTASHRTNGIMTNGVLLPTRFLSHKSVIVINHIHDGVENVSLKSTASDGCKGYEDGVSLESGPGNMREGQRIDHWIDVVGVERSL